MLIKLCFVKNSPPPPDAERETAFPVFIKRRFVHTETAWTVCVKRRGLQSLRGGGGVPACHRPAAVRGVRRSGRGIPVPPGSLRSPTLYCRQSLSHSLRSSGVLIRHGGNFRRGMSASLWLRGRSRRRTCFPAVAYTGGGNNVRIR